jgi:hypothetical protein
MVVRGRAKLVLEDVARFGHPIMPMPTASRASEEYNRELDRNRVLNARRLDEMADRLCLPVPYVVAILVKLEDSGVVDWLTGEINPKYASEGTE